MVKVPKIWSTYQKYDKKNSRNMVKVAQICSTWSMYQKYDQHARNMVKKNRVMVKIPELWLTYHKYGRHTRNMAAFFQFFYPFP